MTNLPVLPCGATLAVRPTADIANHDPFMWAREGGVRHKGVPMACGRAALLSDSEAVLATYGATGTPICRRGALIDCFV